MQVGRRRVRSAGGRQRLAAGAGAPAAGLCDSADGHARAVRDGAPLRRPQRLRHRRRRRRRPACTATPDRCQHRTGARRG